MIWGSARDSLLIALLAIAVDALVGDPARLPHPVVGIGKLISRLERLLLRTGLPPAALRARGTALALTVTVVSGGLAWAAVALAASVHPWLGIAANVWLVSTTLAVKGLKQAAWRVYEPLKQGNLPEAREQVRWIVGRDTDDLSEKEVTRAAVETVAENTVDAFVSPLFFALLGGAPLAMLYRAANTLDSMVGYRNDKYRYFGWASARLDDALNWLPARAAGWLLALAAAARKGASAAAARRAVRRFAKLHPSPNSGIPESAVAGALGVELGGTNRYGGVPSERARMGWPTRELRADDIADAVGMLYGVRYWIAGGLLCAWLAGWR